MTNKNYSSANYTVAIELAKPVADVFYHIVNDVSKYWPEEFEGESTRLNDEFVFSSGDSHYSKNKVIELVPDKKVVWLVTESIRKTDNFDWTGTKMIFELTPKDDSTLLTFTYDGVILENEYDRLVMICNMVIKDLLYNFITNANKNYTISIEVKQPADVVFDRINEVSKWWSKDFTGSSAELNDEFVICHPGAHYSKQKLVEVIPGRKVVWLVTDSNLDWLTNDQHEWTNTKMIFEITAAGDKTILHFTHEGLVPEKECYSRCTQGWDMVIKDRLFNFITSGKTI